MQEITLAKKCKLNSWVRPPPELDPNHHKVDWASPETLHATKRGFGGAGFEISPTKINTIKEVTEPKGDESPAKAAKAPETIPEGEGDEEGKAPESEAVFEPLTRSTGGIWILAQDFPSVF